MLPIATGLGLSTLATLSGSVAIELVFNRPGIGRLLIDAIAAARLCRDPGRRRGVRGVRGADQPADGPRLRPHRSTRAGDLNDHRRRRPRPRRARCRSRTHARMRGDPVRPARRRRSRRVVIVVFVVVAVARAADRALRPADAVDHEHQQDADAGSTGWAPTSSAATCSAALLYGSRNSLLFGFISPVLAAIFGTTARRHRRLFRRHRRPHHLARRRPAAGVPGAAARHPDRGGARRRLLEHHRGHHRRLRPGLCARRAGADAGGQAGALCRGGDRRSACARR